jgi:hypothetical protein
MDGRRMAKTFFADMNKAWIGDKNQLRKKCHHELFKSNGYEPKGIAGM